MSDKFIQVIKADEVAPGGMKAVELDGNEVIICNCDGKYFAIPRRCGHMNAPLDMGTLDGKYITCPMHCAQFDVTNGEALSGPVPADFGKEIPPPMLGEYLENIGKIMKHVHTESIHTYATKIESGCIQVAF
jgi:3-phenylpropionate/trans-cinnamate dioxygenase ferredoxin subunit